MREDGEFGKIRMYNNSISRLKSNGKLQIELIVGIGK